ncbi:MAG: glycosyltransferase [Chloroflexota bacterium]|nr:MAG: glycosyltransferase [Chloroflexota bacterium]
MRKIVIASLRSAHKPWGGIEMLVLNQALGFKEIPDVRHIIVNLWDGDPPDIPLHEHARAAGLESVVLRANGNYNLDIVGQTRAFLRENKVDLVHCFGFKAEIVGLLANRGLGLPIVGAWVGLMITGPLMQWLHERLSLVTLRMVDRIVSNSEFATRELRRYLVPTRNVVIIPSLVDTEKFAPLAEPERTGMRRELGVDEAVFLLAIVARLVPEKGHRVLFQALADVVKEFPRTRLLVVGTGPREEDIKSAVGELGLTEFVTFMGHRTDVPRIIGASDALVSSSYREGISISLLEAMSIGKPIVATAIGGSVEALEDGRTGLLVPPGDSTAIAAALRRLASDPDSARAMGREARRVAQERYSIPAVTRQVHALYEDILRGRGTLMPATDDRGTSSSHQLSGGVGS